MIRTVEAAYSNNGWAIYITNAEDVGQTEMCMIYHEAWENVKREISMADGESSGNAELGQKKAFPVGKNVSENHII